MSGMFSAFKHFAQLGHIFPDPESRPANAELREDASSELREDGSFELRE